MKLPPKARGGILAASLATTLAAVFLAPPADEVRAVVAPSRLSPSRLSDTVTQNADDDIPTIVITRAGVETPQNDPFLSRVPPPPAPALPPPPPPLSAPPLPFVYLGKMVEDGATVVFLGKQDNNYSVRAGDTLDKLYRLEKIDDQAITLVYLPLDQQQTLFIGSNNN